MGPPFRVTQAGDMFQLKIGEIFKELPSVFGIASLENLYPGMVYSPDPCKLDALTDMLLTIKKNYSLF